jgi:hypothetical protein
MLKSLLTTATLLVTLAVAAAPADIDQYNVTWETPSKNAAGSMPLGNGELGINLWVEENGDLQFYLSRNDSFSEISQLCKAGKVRISLSPNPFKTGAPFRQELKLRNGVCEITGGAPGEEVKLRVFVDAANPVVQVTGKSAKPITVTARIESWRKEKQKVGTNSSWTLHGGPGELWQAPDVFPAGIPDAVAWYHRNETSPAFESTIKIQSLEPIRSAMKDPLLHRTFGGWITGKGFNVVDASTMATPAPVTEFAVRVASPSAQTETAQEWLDLAKAAAAKSADAEAALTRTIAYWQGIWERSWVICDSGSAKGVPANDHPLHIGTDSQGGSKFPGSIGGVAVHGQPLTADRIAELAAGEAKTASAAIPALPDFQDGFTLEAWVKPDGASAGRILDKITVGGGDGFLLDNHPGNSLRLIVGSTILQAPGGILKMGQWQHVAGTFDAKSGAMQLFLNGKPVAGSNAKQAQPMTVGKAHTLQRYQQACAGRGIFPIKFNGSIFTVEAEGNPDWRKWGDCHWWQNVRMPYHAMQACGDFDLMQPLFTMFESIRPFAEARAKLYHNVEGCYFAETMTVWGTYSNGDYGWDRKGHQPNEVLCPWWQYAWNQGLELVALQLDYYDYTQDQEFLKTRLLPMATSVLKYFDNRFKKDAEGRIVIDPDQAVETYWFGVINDTPCVAGLNDLANRLCTLPETATSPEQRAFFTHMKAAAPILPVEDAKLNGKPVRRIAVAQKYNPQRNNCENPELFPIWPFRLVGLGRPLLEEARNAYALRGAHNDVGWGYDSNAAALLGLTDEAARILNVKIRNSHGGYRWPATWGPNFDWLPDHCHGGNLVETTNLMLLQPVDTKILLLPAWPRKWDVSFKLHAPGKTTVECELKGGKITHLNVIPAAREKDVILPDWAK